MRARSWLFVPGDSDRKLARAEGAGADALILDLEDSVAPSGKTAAREKVAAYLANRPAAARASRLWVRVNALDDGALGDLAAVMPGAPDGIVLPKSRGPADMLRLAHWLDAFEAAHGLPPGCTTTIPVASETPAATLNLAAYAEARVPRLAGLTWGAEDLSTALGASTNRAADGGFAPAYQYARTATLLAARAAGVLAIDTLHADFRDAAGLEAGCRAASSEGFDGRLAIHPDQVAVINAAFTPSPEAVAWARRVVAMFAAQPGAGVVGLDGRMLDVPHLKQARAVLLNAEATGRLE